MNLYIVEFFLADRSSEWIFLCCRTDRTCMGKGEGRDALIGIKAYDITGHQE